jgi:hypothetical protein
MLHVGIPSRVGVEDASVSWTVAQETQGWAETA